MNRPMDGPRLVIVGAGVAGLAAGCYAARSGYRTTIFEMHDLPGGLCTSWRRKGYLFDGSVAGLAGTSPEMPIYQPVAGPRGDRFLPAVRHGGLRLRPQPGRQARDRLHGRRPARGRVPGRVPGRRRGRARVLCRRQRLPPHRHPVPHGGRPARRADDAPLGARVAARAAGAAQVRARSPCGSSRGSSPTPSAPRCSTTSCTSADRTCRCSRSCCRSPTPTGAPTGIPLHGWLTFAQRHRATVRAARG